MLCLLPLAQELTFPFCYDKRGEVKAGEKGWFEWPVLSWYQGCAGAGLQEVPKPRTPLPCHLLRRCIPAAAAPICLLTSPAPSALSCHQSRWLTFYYNDLMIRQGQVGRLRKSKWELAVERIGVPCMAARLCTRGSGRTSQRPAA